MKEKQIVQAVAYILLLALLADIYINMHGNHIMVILTIVMYTVTMLAINHIYRK